MPAMEDGKQVAKMGTRSVATLLLLLLPLAPKVMERSCQRQSSHTESHSPSICL